MRRINTLLRGVSQKTHVGGVNSTGHAHSSEPTLLHVVDMFGFENSEVTPFTSHYGAIMYWLRMCVLPNDLSCSLAWGGWVGSCDTQVVVVMTMMM